MSASKPKRIAIVGAGPTGLEAALYASRLGHAVKLFDSGEPGAHVRDWGRIRLFTPWSMNASPLGISTLFPDRPPPWDPAACPTGQELLETYLVPLSQSDEILPGLRPGRRVVAVGRDRMDKLEPMGRRRSGESLRLLVESGDGESIEYADLVLDCSGTYATPCSIGSGGIPAPGERDLGDLIDYRLSDVVGKAQAFAGKRVLLVGSGYTAATSLEALSRSDVGHVAWVTRCSREQPIVVEEDDPLSGRARLGRKANEFAAGSDPRIERLPGAVVDRLRRHGTGLVAELRIGSERRAVEADRLLAHTGHEPDGSIYRQLQVHECFASMGPMKLAATLQNASGDCLSQRSAGADSLATPEPGFFILGAKSYGKHSSYLMRLGWEQIRDLFAMVESKPELDLYQACRTPAEPLETNR